MSEKQKFIDYLKSKGFTVSPVLHTLQLVPHYYKTPKGHHALISNISCCLFDGCNTKQSDLGCIVFYYGGTMRYKYHRQSISAELLKMTLVPKNYKAAIKSFEYWRNNTVRSLAGWALVI